MRRYFVFLFSILSLSCGDFLNEYSQELAYADDCDDLNEILIGQGYLSHDGDEMTLLYSDIENQAAHYFPYLHIMDDDVVENIFGWGPGLESVSNTAIYKFRNMYIWAKDPFTNIIGEPFEDCDWSRLYRHISTVNVVIERADEFTNDPKELRDKVKGEAYFLRGAYYFLLVNLYAKPYVKETADEDLGVPLKTTEMVVDGFFSRNTVAEVYKQIISDLETSIQLLHDKKQLTHFHVNEVSARILLSRVFLYMGNYLQAEQQCNEAIALGCPLRNLNTMNLTAMGINKEYMHQNSCENLFTMGTPTIQTLMRTRDQSFANFAVSDDLYDLYIVNDEIEDLRRQCFFNRSSWYGTTCVKSPLQSQMKLDAYETFLIRSVEAYLNKAEAQVMMGNDEQARKTLDEILKNRYKENKLPQISDLVSKDLVDFIRAERRRELCFEGHRWFDLRRYAVSPLYQERKEIRHDIYDQVGDMQSGMMVGSYILKAYGEDNAWVLPIPRYELIFNNEKGNVLIDNPERLERLKL